MGRYIYYNRTNTCDKIKKVGFSWRRCGEKLYPKNAFKIFNEKGWTGLWECKKCHDRRRFRKGYGQNCSKGKGDNFQKLACIQYGYIDINAYEDNLACPIDLIDPKSGFYYQVKGRLYNSYYQRWVFSSLERDYLKDFEDMVLYCASYDGKIIERIYRIPKNEIDVSSISIYKNASEKRYTPWYEKYRIKDEKELKKANDIWKNIIGERC